METYQLILIGLAGCVGLSMFWDKIQGIPAKLKKPETDHITIPQDDFLEIIASWGFFKSKCEDAGLEEVCKRLYEIFPLLIVAEKANKRVIRTILVKEVDDDEN